MYSVELHTNPRLGQVGAGSEMPTRMGLGNRLGFVGSGNLVVTCSNLYSILNDFKN
jgi:hypothetical protein